MRQILFFFASLVLASNVFSQIIFSENFNASLSLPTGWSSYDEDGLVPDRVNIFGTVSEWTVAKYETGNNVLVSTSFFDPDPGQANDWVVTPKISIPATGNYQFFLDARASDPAYADGFMVYVSTTGNTVADFTEAPLLDVPEAPSSSPSGDDWTMYQINLNAYLGQDIWIAVRNNSDDKYLLFIDNFIVRNVYGNDASVEEVDLEKDRYVHRNTENYIYTRVKNRGANIITSLEVNWNDGTDHVSTVSGLDIATMQDSTLKLPIPVKYADLKTSNITVTVTKVNGQDDSDPSNNSKSTIMTTVSKVPARYILFEEGTGTWCGWCPRGMVAMEHMQKNYDKFIGVAVHDGNSAKADPMQVTAYVQGANFSGYPGVNIDRALKDRPVDKDIFVEVYNYRKDIVSPVQVKVQTTLEENELKVDLAGTFYTNFENANFRYGVIVVEDSLKGDTWTWTQTNYYAGGDYGTMGGYETKPDPVPASEMVYNHVGRALIGGYTGQVGSIPSVINNEDIVAYTFNYTIPEGFNKEQLSVVAVVIDVTTGEVLNARSRKIIGATDDDDDEGKGKGNTSVADFTDINMSVFPNPATDKITISFEASNSGEHFIQIVDMSGRVVLSQTHTNLFGQQSIELDTSSLLSGAYLVSVVKDGVSFTKTITIQ